MEFRRRSYNSLMLLVIVGIVIFSNNRAFAQCDGNFTYQSVASSKGSASGRIEVVIDRPAPGTYTFKVYEMSGTIRLVDTKESSSPERIAFENLKPATYFVKVEWGQSCYKTLGGLEGIIITESDQER